MMSQPDVDYLATINWHDSELISGVITNGHQSEFPDTICYGGHIRINLDLTYALHQSQLRIIFAGCRHLSFGMIENMSLHSIRVTGTQGATMTNDRSDTLIDASALLYETLG